MIVLVSRTQRPNRSNGSRKIFTTCAASLRSGADRPGASGNFCNSIAEALDSFYWLWMNSARTCHIVLHTHTISYIHHIIKLYLRHCPHSKRFQCIPHGWCAAFGLKSATGGHVATSFRVARCQQSRSLAFLVAAPSWLSKNKNMWDQSGWTLWLKPSLLCFLRCPAVKHCPNIAKHSYSGCLDRPSWRYHNVLSLPVLRRLPGKSFRCKSGPSPLLFRWRSKWQTYSWMLSLQK